VDDKLVQELVGTYSRILLDLVLVVEELQDIGFSADSAPDKLSKDDRLKLQNANRQVLQALIRTVKNPTYGGLSKDDKLLAVAKIFNRHRSPILLRLANARRN
jgi:hypothetical protein